MRHFGIEDGLPSNKVYEIYRDSKGFLWIGTDKGVARFNGIKFEKFTTFDGLSDNEVFFFQEDNIGRIWIATFNGELCYYQDGTFHNPRNTPFLKLSFNVSDYINYIVIEPDSTVTIGFHGNPNIINIRNDRIIVQNIQNKYNDSILHETQLYDQSGIQGSTYWIVNSRKINDSTREINYPNKSVCINNENKIVQIKSHPYNKLRYYCFTQNVRLYCDDSLIYDTTGQNALRKPIFLNANTINKSSAYNIHRIYINKKYKLYVVSNGLYDDSSLVLKRNNISSITQDETGNYWLSTLNDGIFSMSEIFNNKKFIEKGYTAEVKYSCLRNGRLIYVTDDNNVFYLDGNKPVCLFDYQSLKHTKLKHPSEPGYLLDSNYRFYCFYGNDFILISNILNGGQKKIYKLDNEDGVKSIFSINDIIYYNSGYNLFKVDYSKLPERLYVLFRPMHLNSGGYDRIFCLAQYRDGSLWYSTRNSVYKLVKDNGVLQSQFRDKSFKMFDFCGKYLVGCSHDNILHIANNFETNPVFDSVGDQNCIWDRLYKIDSSHLLISTNSNYRLLTLHWSDNKPKFDILTIENPIIPQQAESICSDGKNCYFFKKGSITSVDVKTLFAKSLPPILNFSYLKIGKTKLVIKDEYSIPFENPRTMTFAFSTISFGGKDVDYQYSISGNEVDNWSGTYGEDISLINPDYGDYIIKVRAKTLSSDYCTPIVFKLHIMRPYWATWWFIALTVLAAAGIITLLVRGRLLLAIAKRERAHDDKVKFMKSEYKALNALMNPHFIFNTLNNVQSLVNGNDKLAANEYLRVFADLVRQNMHNVSKELIPLQKEIDLVTNYLSLEKLRFEDKLGYKINIDDDLELYDIMIPPLLIQPLVENSIKHGILPLVSRSGFIEINISEQDNVLIMEIKDNGVGLNNSKEKTGSLHESFGLDNIRKRIEQLSIIQGKEITFRMGHVTDDDNVVWTTVTVTMQL